MRRETLVVFSKEFREHFSGSLAYTVIAGFALFSAVWLFGVVDFFEVGRATLRPLFSVMPYTLLVTASATTMQSWAGERRQGTAEMLFSLPVHDASLILGKFLASFLVLLCAIAATIPTTVLVVPFGEFDVGEIAGQYLGVVLFALVAVAVGQLCSALARSQITAFFLSLFVLLVLTLAGVLAESAVSPFFVSALRYISLTTRLENFNRGLIHTGDLLFLLTSSAASLLVTARLIKTRRAV